MGAVIQLGNCLDFTDTRYTKSLATTYDGLKVQYDRGELALPSNSGKGGKSRRLDCLVVNTLVETAEKIQINFQTIRAPFMEGEPAFPEAGIALESHIQLAVRDQACILGVFRPNLNFGGPEGGDLDG